MDTKVNNKLILFGVGNRKRKIATLIAECCENIVAVIDNDSSKWGQLLDEKYEIFPVDKVKEFINEDITIILTTISFHDEMKEQLRNLGWNGKIFSAKEAFPWVGDFATHAWLNDIDLNSLKPTCFHIELSGYCNCKCLYCPFHGEANIKEGHKGFMNWLTLEKTVEQIRKIPSIEMVDTTGPGEIFLNKEWFEMLSYILEKCKIKKVKMYTNGMLLTKENVEKIILLPVEAVQMIVSIDGETPEENDEFRIGSNYQVIKQNVYNALEIIKKTNSDHRVGIQITNCYPYTIEELEALNYKIHSKISEVPKFLQNDFKDFVKSSQKTISFGGKTSLRTAEIEWPENYVSRCLNLFNRIIVDYAGNLLRCSCGNAGIEAIGNVFEDDILRLWETEKEINIARSNFIEGKYNKDFCDGCAAKGRGKYRVVVRE